MELEHGSPAKAYAMFESLVANFPKRVDLWNVYIDQLVKGGQVVQAR